MAQKTIESEQSGVILPGGQSPYFIKTRTTFTPDINGNPIEGSAITELLYTPNGNIFYVAATSTKGGAPGTWIPKQYTPSQIFEAGIAQYAKAGDNILGETALISLNTSKGQFYTAAQNSIIKTAAANNIVKDYLHPIAASTKNSAPAGNPKEPPQPPPGSSSETQPSSETDENGNPIPTSEQSAKLKKFGNNPEIPGLLDKIRGDVGNEFGWFRYPVTIDKNGQDYLKFDIIKYGKRVINEGGIGLKKRVNSGPSVGTICLPIQPSISDSNRVNWNEDTVNIFDLGSQTFGMGVMEANDLSAQINKVTDTIKSKVQNPTIKDGLAAILTTQAAQKAIQSQNNLLSRMSGAILNPNMELLFQGPTLRPFQFTFRMTPRDEDEANQIRSIIRTFKEASAVQQGIENLFLKAPYIFRIKYILGKTKKDHPSINRIKECALQQVSVDYTPDQTFMTYNDVNATMSSYAMSLTFTELEPVYAEDYAEDDLKANIDYIGY